MDVDDNWGLSAEELDFLEQDAIRKISERKASSAAASTAAVTSTTGLVSSSSQALPPPSHFPSILGSPTKNPPPGRGSCAPPNQPRPFDKNQVPFPSGSHEQESGMFNKNVEAEKQPEGNLPKLSVRFFLHASEAIAAKFPYHPVLVEAFRKVPKATWHAKERLWIFPISSLSIAEEVLKGVTEAKVEFQRVDPFVQRALCAAAAVPNLLGLYGRMPDFIETKLLPFQQDGVRFVLQHGGRALLADEMGLGKTLQAIAVSTCLQDSWPVLVLTPPALRLHWASMIQQWLNIPPCDILVVLSQYGGSNRAGFKILSSSNNSTIQLDGVFNIISYDTVAKLQDLLLACEFKIIIADESHYLKNAQAKRTGACLPVLKKATYKILLSGTPALSRPIELYKQLEALYPTVYSNVHEYGNRYCKGGIFGVYQGASNHEELHNLMKATVMIRRLKKDVLSELPTKRRQQVFLELSEKELKQIRPLFLELELIKGNLKTCQSAEEMESLKVTQKNIISKIYTTSAEAKITAVLDYLSTVVDAGCKFLVFAHHRPMIDAIHEFLLKRKVGCIRIDGSTPTSLRQGLVAEFQDKESITAAVLSIKAGGIGLTLTAASTVIFAELSWNPGDIIQAEDRAHRIGQASSVNVYYLLANDTVDDIIWDVLHNKLDNLGQVLDGHDNSSLDVSVSRVGSSPTKQGTLDIFLKRCQGPSEEQRKLKAPRY